MKQRLRAYNNGSTHGSPSLQVASNEQSTVESTTCMAFEDTSRKYYPAIVVLTEVCHFGHFWLSYGRSAMS